MATTGVVLALIGTGINLYAVGWSWWNVNPESYEHFPARTFEGHTKELVEFLTDLAKVDRAHVLGSVIALAGGVLTLTSAI